jgi:hypothetical protein
MIKADCDGSPIQLNIPIDAGIPGHERVIGNNFGVYAKPLPSSIDNLVIAPYDTTATLTWTTPAPTATQVQFGSTPSYGTTVSNSTLLKNHAVTLNGLNPSTIYYFQITSSVGSYACSLQTTNFAVGSQVPLFDITKAWKYTTNDLDGINWQTRAYDDSSWGGPGPGLLYIENNPSVFPLNTPLPSKIGTDGTPQSGAMAPTYYFRTHFTLSGSPAGVTLLFSNFVDDAAVFYLNGTEIQRLRMALAPAVIANADLSYPPGAGACAGANEATCADLFSISAAAATLTTGDNVLAVEVHQSTTTSSDIVFGSALAIARPQIIKPTLNITREGNATTIYWNGTGFTLQQASFPKGPWTDVPGPVTRSTFILTAPTGTKFYGLRQ